MQHNTQRCNTRVAVCHTCNTLSIGRRNRQYIHTLHHSATRCNTLQHAATRLIHAATRCYTLQHAATHCATCNTLSRSIVRHNRKYTHTLQHRAKRYNTEQNAATHYNTLQHAVPPATHHLDPSCDAAGCTLMHKQTRTHTHAHTHTHKHTLTRIRKHIYLVHLSQHTILQHTATHCNTLQHAATHIVGSCLSARYTATQLVLQYKVLQTPTRATHTYNIQARVCRTATHCKTLQHIQYTGKGVQKCNTLQKTATHTSHR